ncbi:thioredoxin domain-containing protein [Nocardioides sp. R-C-SC26]|uniref:DsbA family protein n=1 Tax=Nocardioides sp. R-C-SC26 TaxID=2870414 RepID=UPI001E4D4D9A|nr:thioredoxin domain-containing protein [Nocardioides sp. R-C-SC26]
MSVSRSKAQERAERHAAAQAAARRRERRRNLLTGLAVVAVIAALVGGGFLINRANDSAGAIEDAAASGTASSDHSLAVGSADAPHSIVIYEDFLCPLCGIVEQTAGERLTALAEAGKVRLEYRPMVVLDRLGPYSADALNAFFVVQDAAGDEVAKAFHDLLFADQPSESQTTFPDADWLVQKAVEAGADEDEVRAGIEDDARADDVAAATKAAGAAGVTGTPTILLDGQVFRDGRTYEEVADNLVAAVQ